MRTSEIRPGVCTFCAELAGDVQNSNYFRLAGPTAKSRIVWRNGEFALMPSLGSLVEGHLLLIPTQHAFSFASLPRIALGNTESLIASITQFFRRTDQQSLVFEHGAVVLSGCEYEKRMKRAICGACTDHAHIHIVPRVSANLVVSKLEDLPIQSRKSLKALCEFADNVNRERPYILIGGTDIDSWLIFELDYVPSQFMRKIVSSSMGLKEWDWRQFPRINLVQQMIETIGPQLEEWLGSNTEGI